MNPQEPDLREQILAPDLPRYLLDRATTTDANLRWNAARIPVQRRGHTLDDLALPQAVLAAAEDFVNSFTRRHVPETTPLTAYPAERDLIGVGLTLTGLPKTGKTSVGCAILTEIALTSPSYPPVTILYTPWPDYTHAFNERHAWRSGRDGGYEENLVALEADLALVAGCSLVMLDDVGQEHSTASGAARDELGRLVRSRHRRGLVTITATSLAPAALGELYGAQLADFLLDTFTVVHVRVS